MAARPLTARRNTLVGDHPTCSAQTMQEAYESGEVIGTGSFGIIRKVKRRPDGVILARKELNYGRMDERDLKQLTEEVNILEQLGSNDNIVRYHERFVDKPNNMLYILMEYCEGGDLAGVIQRCRKSGTVLSEDVVWAYLAQITLALYDCHSEVDSNGKRKPIILHRDIKPENVFLDKDNNLKLGDFGLSKAMAQAAMTNTYVGTPYYMSPELINGQPYDIKSDVWALGCLIYELCAGHPPFHEARTQPELAVLIREGKIPDLPKPYTPHLGQVVRAMLKQNPKHRPNTSQIKALDNVKLQIRAIELRKATKELRHRDQQMALRERELMAREATVLGRERAVLMRENSVRAGAEALRNDRLHWAEETRRDERENERPRETSSSSGTSTTGSEEELLARVAGRPSMVPRRPLEERRISISNLTFPRLPSSSSLMSLDNDTPTKATPVSLRKRLASRSMYDLKAAAAPFPSMPSRSPLPTRYDSSIDLARLAATSEYSSSTSSTRTIDANAGLTAPVASFGRRSGSASGGSPTKPSSLSSSFTTNHSRSPTAPASFRPTVASRALTAPAGLPSTGTITDLSNLSITPTTSAHNSPAQHSPIYDDDNLPSPFLKKMDGTRFPSAPSSASLSTTSGSVGTSGRGSLGGIGESSRARRAPLVPTRAAKTSLGGASSGAPRPSMASRLLATRAQARESVDEVGRRISGVTGRS